MKKSIISILAIFLISVALGSNIFSQQGRGWAPYGRGFGPGFNFAYNYRMLDLSDEQLDQIKEARLEQAEALKPLQEELQDARDEYRKLMWAEEKDLEAINKNIDQQTAVQNKIMKLNAQFRNKLENVLTEDQKNLLGSGLHPGRGFYGKGDFPGTGYGRGTGRGFGRDFRRGYGRGYGRGPIW